MLDLRADFTRAKGAQASYLTYEPHYGLREKPFSLSTDPRFLYKSGTHATAFEELRAGIRRREGLIVLTGEPGTGKTTLCRSVLESLDRRTFYAFVPDPFVSREDLLKMVLIDFGVMSVEELKNGRLNGTSRPELSYPLYEFLRSLVPLQAYAVLIIDEAQNLSPSLLEEIRILSDLEAPEKLLQVVLVGQPELRSKMTLPEIRQVNQRVSVRCDLKALDKDAVAGYIAHRLAVAGGGSDRVAFSKGAVDAVHRMSAGVPRLINLICDRALSRGSAEGCAVIELAMIEASGLDLRLTSVPQPRVGPKPAAAPAPRRREPPSLPDVEEQQSADHLELPPDFMSGHALREARAPVAVLQAPREEPARASRWSEGLRRLDRPVTRWVGAAALALAGIILVWNAGSPLLQVFSGVNETISLPRLPEPPQLVSPSAASTRMPLTVAASLDAAAEARLYAINVALFDEARRSRILVEQLRSTGYRAYAVGRNLGARGLMHEVSVGPYIFRMDADIDLARIHQTLGYADARVIATR